MFSLCFITNENYERKIKGFTSWQTGGLVPVNRITLIHHLGKKMLTKVTQKFSCLIPYQFMLTENIKICPRLFCFMLK